MLHAATKMKSHRSFFFFFNEPAPTEIYTLSLHDALPIFALPRGRGEARLQPGRRAQVCRPARRGGQALRGVAQARVRGPRRGPDRERLQRARDDPRRARSEEHTSELQSRFDLVCRLLLEK